MKRIGLFGGTFNPIHQGHLKAAQAMLAQCDLQQVIFIPAYLSPHKGPEALIAPEHRLAMLRLALEPFPQFEVSSIEIDRGEVSYSVDTVRHFVQKYEAQAQLYFLLGEDNLALLSTWKEFEALNTFVQWVVVNRPGSHQSKSPFSIQRVTMDDFVLSSTTIRDNLLKGRSVANMLPEKVYRYIQEHHLYQA